MDSTEFQRLLFAGHGRALVFLQDHGSSGLGEIILEACVRNTAYNRQCERDREEYLTDLIDISRLQDFLLPRIFESLRASDPHMDHGYDHDQMLGITGVFAHRGVPKARSLLYEIFQRNCAVGLTKGAYEIIWMDRAAGYAHVLAEIGKHRIAREGQEWKAPAIHKYAIELFGSQEAREILEQTARKVPGLLDFTGTLDQFDSEGEGLRKPSPYVHLPYEQYREVLQKLGPDASNEIKRPWRPKIEPPPVRWGGRASRAELRRAAADLLQASDPTVLFRYLKIFSIVRYPRVPDALIVLLDHPEPAVATSSFVALQNISHPRIRAAALARLESPEWGSFALRLLTRNFEPGDARRIEPIVNSASTVADFHDLSQSALEVIEQHEDDWGTLLLQTYTRNPCSICRNRAVEMLDVDDLLTPELVRECLLDCNEQTRETARKCGSDQAVPDPTGNERSAAD